MMAVVCYQAVMVTIDQWDELLPTLDVTVAIFMIPVAIADYRGMQNGDGLLVGNFRADRVRQISAALLDPAFKEFPRPRAVH